MSDAIYSTMSKALGQVNDTLRGVFGRDGAVCYLLRRGEYTGEFEKIREITSGFYVEYGLSSRGYIAGDLREDIFLDCADVDEDFPDDFAVATHVAWGIPDCDNRVFVYAMDPEQKDRTHPDGASPTYKAFLTRVQNERYTVD